MHRRLLPLLSSLALAAQAPPVAEAPLRAHLAFLSDDLLEGRAPASRGGQLAAAYFEAQLRALGLKPLKGDSFRQEVPLDGIRPLSAQSSFRVRGSASSFPVELGKEAVLSSGQLQTELTVDAPLVFAGYGIQAPEEDWDDFKGVDCRGKILVLLGNEPPPTPDEPMRFDGENMTYCGRWPYKLDQGPRHGAAGVILIHTDASAGWPWSVAVNSFMTERLQARDRKGNPVEGWITEAFARRLLAAAGQDLDALRTSAVRRDFRPVELGLRLEGSLKTRVRRALDCNVAGLLPGTDPLLKDEAVIYTAHCDHLGMAEPGPGAPGGDRIFNGAWDNASGCAGLLAMAQASVRKPPKRSQIFLFACAEEQGLLGSSAWTTHPLWPLEKTVADLNLDTLNPLGPTRNMELGGLEHTTLGPLAAKVAQAMGLRIEPPSPDPDGGAFRSDHYSFVLAGVPAVNVSWGEDFPGEPAEVKKRLAAFYVRYHQVTDEYDPSWNLEGMVQNAQYALNLGHAIADAPERPKFLPKPAASAHKGSLGPEEAAQLHSKAPEGAKN